MLATPVGRWSESPNKDVAFHRIVTRLDEAFTLQRQRKTSDTKNSENKSRTHSGIGFSFLCRRLDRLSGALRRSMKRWHGYAEYKTFLTSTKPEKQRLVPGRAMEANLSVKRDSNAKSRSKKRYGPQPVGIEKMVGCNVSCDAV